VYATRQLVDVAMFPLPPLRPDRDAPVRDRRPRFGRVRALLRAAWTAHDEPYLPLVVNRYPY
jgi:hypothetical protein